MKNKNQYQFDVFVLIFLLILAVSVTLWWQPTFLVSIFLFFVLPSIWLSYRKPDRIPKLLLFSVLFTLPFVFIIDHLAVLDQTWHVPTIFPFRLLGTIPLEDVFWGITCTYLITIFYEYFLDKYQDKLIYKSMKYFLIAGSICLLGFFFLFFFQPELLQIQYVYLLVGLILCLFPAVIILFSFPHLLTKFFSTVAYFFPLFLAMELVALKVGHWNFPGTHFIGWINIFGQKFPFEELLFWIFLFPISILSYYEYFNDDRR